MIKYYSSVVYFFLLLVVISSCTNKAGKREGDVSALLHLYNTQVWGDFIHNRESMDSVVKADLLDLSYEIGGFAKQIGIQSGGLNKDMSLLNPMKKNPLDAKEILAFYNQLSKCQLKFESIEGREGLKKEIDVVIFFIFLNENGMLSKDKISSMKVVDAVSTLFILENMCYYLIVKYA